MKKGKKKLSSRIISTVIAIVIIAVTVGLGSSGIDWSQLSEKPIDEVIIDRAEEILQNDATTEDVEKNEQDQQKPENIPIIPGEELMVYVFDVGQADCILLSCGGEYMIIDGGNNPDGKLVVKQLQSMGITELKYAVGTHTHEDHIGGLDKIIDAFDIGVLYMPSNEYDSATYRDVVEAAEAKNIDKIAPELGYVFYLGSARCEVMAIDNENEDPNLTSIILEVVYGDTKFLFTGDAETPNEEARLWNDIDVLKVGHHGSSTSTGEDFMEQIKPEIALISVGEGNSYGHPHDEVMELLNEYQVEIYRTDTQGTIVVTSDGSACTVETFKSIDLEGNT